jgi:hypothetical protein
MRIGFIHAALILAVSARAATAQPPTSYSPTMHAGTDGAQTVPTEALPLAPTLGPQAPPPVGPNPNGPPPLPDCGPGAFDPPAPREPPPGSFTAEYLHWWVHKTLPPLVTSSESGAPGILGQTGTLLIFGGSLRDTEDHNGARLTMDHWFQNAPFGIEGRVDYLGERRTSFDVASHPDGAPALSRPVINALTGQETAENVSLPGAFAGGIQAYSSTFWWDAQTNLLVQIDPVAGMPGLFLGLRYMDLDENLNIFQNSTALLGGLVGNNGNFFGQPTNAFIVDQFRTRNQFMGGQIGGQMKFEGPKLFCQLRGSFGVGYTHQDVTAFGSSTLTFADGTVNNVPGGLLVQPTNGGHFTHDKVSVLPEGEVTLGWHICCWADFLVGYNFLYWSNVVRPGDVVDRTINPTQLPTSVQGTGLVGAPRPAMFHDSDFWAQGLSLGLEIHF